MPRASDIRKTKTTCCLLVFTSLDPPSDSTRSLSIISMMARSTIHASCRIVLLAVAAALFLPSMMIPTLATASSSDATDKFEPGPGSGQQESSKESGGTLLTGALSRLLASLIKTSGSGGYEVGSEANNKLAEVISAFMTGVAADAASSSGPQHQQGGNRLLGLVEKMQEQRMKNEKGDTQGPHPASLLLKMAAAAMAGPGSDRKELVKPALGLLDTWQVPGAEGGDGGEGIGPLRDVIHKVRQCIVG